MSRGSSDLGFGIKVVVVASWLAADGTSAYSRQRRYAVRFSPIATPLSDDTRLRRGFGGQADVEKEIIVDAPFSDRRRVDAASTIGRHAPAADGRAIRFFTTE